MKWRRMMQNKLMMRVLRERYNSYERGINTPLFEKKQGGNMMQDTNKTNQNYSIEIDDGFVEVEVKNQFGEHVGAVRINPGDINIIDREEKAEQKIKQILEEVKDTAAETEEDEDILEEKLLELDAKIKEQIDILFDYKVSETIFKNQHCLAVSHGRYYIERLLEAFEPVIAKIVEKETKESQKRMDKYLKKYTPQDHKKKGKS